MRRRRQGSSDSRGPQTITSPGGLEPREQKRSKTSEPTPEGSRAEEEAKAAFVAAKKENPTLAGEVDEELRGMDAGLAGR